MHRVVTLPSARSSTSAELPRAQFPDDPTLDDARTPSDIAALFRLFQENAKRPRDSQSGKTVALRSTPPRLRAITTPFGHALERPRCDTPPEPSGAHAVYMPPISPPTDRFTNDPRARRAALVALFTIGCAFGLTASILLGRITENAGAKHSANGAAHVTTIAVHEDHAPIAEPQRPPAFSTASEIESEPLDAAGDATRVTKSSRATGPHGPSSKPAPKPATAQKPARHAAANDDDEIATSRQTSALASSLLDAALR